MRDFDAWLKALVSNDHQLADELRSIRESAAVSAEARGVESRARDLPARDAQAAMRTIVLRAGRPVLAVVGNTPQLEFTDSASEVWRSRLQAASGRLQRAARAVGRIDVSGHPQQLAYVGTGWLVEADTVLTNRHVAREFGRQTGNRFTFSKGTGDDPIQPSIDFLEEAGHAERLEFQIVEILHIEDDDGPDLALLRVENTSSGPGLADPIPLAESPAGREQQIAVIGYPARDSRVPDDQLMHAIFGEVYDKKRVAPGQVTSVGDKVVQHDCSTLGGNSGSVLLDLASGKAVGLHFAGRFLEANFAVPAILVARRLDAVRRRAGGAGTPTPTRPGEPTTPNPTVPPSTSPPAPGRNHEVMVEGVVAEYDNRAGYDPMFVSLLVPLPVANASDVLTFSSRGVTSHELKYEHFSVVMSRSRRLCIFSAGNIDGRGPRRFKRPDWRLDPRIPTAQQIRDECYGSEPKFSRGHMTRREDPVWGAEDEASRGNRDSMHVTNTVPQMQPFNAGIWLGLESYALDQAREDDMRISVFTGPFLLADDPVRDGVMIPRSFWKVIAFVHDETRQLCATGYTMSQEEFLREEEFVFGQHRTAQVRIRGIEQRAGLSFGPLAALDPFSGDQEGVDVSLNDPSQIRFS